MTKKELKYLENNKLITETIYTYAWLLQNDALGRGTKQLEKHFADCCEEMLKREIITQEDVDRLNM